MHSNADQNECFGVCLLTKRASADVPGHAGSALPCPAVRPHTDTVLRGHLQVPDQHILTHGNSLACKTGPYGINRGTDTEHLLTKLAWPSNCPCKIKPHFC